MNNDSNITAMYTNFKALREEKGLSITELADITSLTENIVRKLECEKVMELSVDKIFRMCSFYKIEIHEIFMQK